MRLFLCGDVMTGRGIDQVMPHPSEPRIYERFMRSAQSYVGLAERVNGPIPRQVAFDYIWGDCIGVLMQRSPDVRIVNLETAVSTHDQRFRKRINYRMHPANLPCLHAAGIDCCVLANNHVLDWGVPGLEETLKALRNAGIATAGAGQTAVEAALPAALPVPGGRRVLVFALGAGSSGIPRSWAAKEEWPGVNFLQEPLASSASRVAAQIRDVRGPDDVVVVSVHWGDNWGYRVPAGERKFAHALIDAGAADIVHGHSSHHPKGIEIYDGRLILYGCGDFINDYEGIGGHQSFRPDLAVAYFADFDADATRLAGLELVVFQRRRFRLVSAGEKDVQWLAHAVGRECGRLGTGLIPGPDGSLRLRW